MVQIHPFANGNGRHTRLMADLLVQQSGGEAFSWGGRDLGALRQADAGDFGALLAFARR
jgi:fido (protein-threonine AMPylation protein)